MLAFIYKILGRIVRVTRAMAANQITVCVKLWWNAPRHVILLSATTFAGRKLIDYGPLRCLSNRYLRPRIIIMAHEVGYRVTIGLCLSTRSSTMRLLFRSPSSPAVCASANTHNYASFLITYAIYITVSRKSQIVSSTIYITERSTSYITYTMWYYPAYFISRISYTCKRYAKYL